jgi:hypothetical protein
LGKYDVTRAEYAVFVRETGHPPGDGCGKDSFKWNKQPEIKDVRIAGERAFEWGYISYKDSSNPKPMRGKVLRVMKGQPDGSWKFARVIVFDENKESAAPSRELWA